MTQLEALEAAMHDGAIGSTTARRLLEVPSTPDALVPNLEVISGLKYRGVLVPALRTPIDLAMRTEVSLLNDSRTHRWGAFVTKLDSDIVTVKLPRSPNECLTEHITSLNIWPIEEYLKLRTKRPHAHLGVAYHVANMHIALSDTYLEEDVAAFRAHFNVC